MQEFIIKSNNSLTRRELVLLGSIFVLVLTLLAVRLLMMGFWMVLPFLLVDFAAVAAAFYLIRKKCSVYESIEISESQLQINHHEKRQSKSWSFDLHWVKVNLQKHAHPWQPSRLLVGSHGKWIEFAGFLTNEERKSLYRALDASINKHLQHV
jgi:uncharacterized membrane protein